MMKCPHCGTPLDLDDNFCSHCGKVNEKARAHIENMQRYQSEFAETKDDVYKTTARYKGISVRMVIIAVLVVLNIIAAIVLGQSYSIVRSINENKSEKNFAKYSSIMDGYLEKGDYFSYDAFVEEKDIPRFDTKYEPYLYINDVVSLYVEAYEQILHCTVEQNEYSHQNETQFLLDYINSFYERQTADYYWDEAGQDSETVQNAVVDMNSKMKQMLILFCNVSEEDAEKFETYSSAERAYIVEEGFKNAE